MKIDLYTRFILTIIAGCLLWAHVLGPMVKAVPAHADRNIVDINIEKVGGRSVFKALPVEILK